jgi:hypothetical protein
MNLMKKSSNPAYWTLLMLGDILFTAFFAMTCLILVLLPLNVLNWLFRQPAMFFSAIWESRQKHWFILFPAFFTSIWRWLYAGSGFILKAARRFDIGFDWFNRKFDIEKKPLQSMGLVAGPLVAVMWWTFVIVRRFV